MHDHGLGDTDESMDEDDEQSANADHPSDQQLGSPSRPDNARLQPNDSGIIADTPLADPELGPESYTRESRTVAQLMARAASVSKRYQGKLLPPKLDAMVTNIASTFLVRTMAKVLTIASRTLTIGVHACHLLAGTANVCLVPPPADHFVVLWWLDFLGMACSVLPLKWFQGATSARLGREAEHDSIAVIDFRSEQVGDPC